MSENKKKCFVITPIGEDGSTIRRHIDGIIKAAIRPALENKYEVRAAHEFTTTGSINNQVIVEIYTSDLVVANLTELNPNVMYELAIRHALKKPVIMIMEKGSKGLPFDINNERTIFYINDSQGVLDLKEELKKVESSINQLNISNPVYDALNNYVSDESLIKNIEAKNKDDANVLKMILNKINTLENSLVNKNLEPLTTRNISSPTIYVSFKTLEDMSEEYGKKIGLEISEKLIDELNRRNIIFNKLHSSYDHENLEVIIDAKDIDISDVKLRKIVDHVANNYLMQLNKIISATCEVIPF